MNVGPIIESLLLGDEISAPQELMAYMVSGEATEAQIAAILIALKQKGASARELAGFARALNSCAHRVSHERNCVVDSCGTGGGTPSFNLSTSASLIAAGAGANVAKHGNRAVTSSCGSADVLELLGINLEISLDRQAEILSSIGFVFMFAPHHHPAMKHVGKVRRELGTRTVFNQLGPLANPASATAQLIGVYSRDLVRPMAEAARELGCKRVLCVYGADGLDEISPVSESFAVYGDESGLHELSLGPFYKDAILDPGESIAANAQILVEAISDPNSPRCFAVLPSAGAVLWLAELADSIQEGILLARAAVADQRALRKLEEFKEASQT
ncbi:MAG: anthranilate phosphoribosyltransferase [Fimbriimonadaceae bacterium]